jgi:type I restriction enzyme S subunit
LTKHQLADAEIVELQKLTDADRPITYGVVKPGPEDPETGVVFIRGGDIANGSINEANLRTITQEVSRPYARTILRGGEVVMSLVGNPGEVAVVPDRLAGANLARQAGLIALKPEIHAPYIKYFLMAPQGRAELFQRTQGAVQQVINLSDLKRVKVRVPSRKVQERIADILSAYDDLIENNWRRIALLEEAARLLYREWFVRLRFPGHEHVKTIDGIPDGWERQPLGAIAETNRESYAAKELPDEINYIDISSVTRGRITSKALMPAAEAPGRARRKARDGDIIWSNVRPNLRAYALILEPEENDVFSTGFTVLTAKEIPFTWLYQFVTTDGFVGHLVNHATGAGYPAVRPDDFERATAVVAPKALLTHFHEAAEPNFRLIAKLNLQNTKLAQARDLLLPRLMNGEIAI